MKRSIGMLALALACADSPPRQSVSTSEPQPAPPPVGLYGTWVRTDKGEAASDTLVLMRDSLARGWINNGERRIALTRWSVKYLSTERPEARIDRGMKLQDGGDAACMDRANAACMSGPVLCVDIGEHDRCFVFAFRSDSLKISTNTWYVRVPPSPDSGTSKTTFNAFTNGTVLGSHPAQSD